MSDIYDCCNTCIHRNKSMWSAVCEPCCGGAVNNYVNAKRIEADNLIKKIKQLEPFNNQDCPEWVVNIIRGEANERNLDNSDRMCNSGNSFSDRKEEMTSEEARWFLITMLQPRNDSRQNAAILKAIGALDIETALGTVIEHWRGNER